MYNLELTAVKNDHFAMHAHPWIAQQWPAKGEVLAVALRLSATRSSREKLNVETLHY